MKSENRKFNLGVIISSIPLVNHVKRIASEQGDDIQVAYKSLYEAVAAGKEMEAAGVEVIMSWRGTASLLRENLHVPVLSFPLTSLDILKCLKQAATLGQKILLPTFRTKFTDIEIMEELLHVKLVQGIYYDAASLEEVILFGQRQECQVVVGGGLSIRFAQKYGLKGVEIQTSDEVISATIESAKSVAQSNREEQKKTQRYRYIIDATSEGIVGVDQNGDITAINKTARQALKTYDQDVIGEPISKYIHKAPIMKVLYSQKPILDNLEKINKELFVFNHIPVMMGREIVGGVSTFKSTPNIIRAEHKIRQSLTKGLVAKYFIEDLMHKSLAIQEVIIKAEIFAPTDSTILILGETGTGKEILAQSIHNLSRRKDCPFVSINCAALPEQLLESELFGYEEGAFTGSKKGGKPGLFEIAHQGTIFLDEIATPPQSVQIRLLRVLQEREVMRVGGDRLIPVDVRVIATANKDLGEEVQSGRFREDLFFRLNVLRIHIPPLRDRIEDIPVLVQEFIQRKSREQALKSIAIQISYIKKLMEYSWPGNVRQLKNFVERLVLLCGSRFSPETFEQLYLELTQYQSNLNKPRKEVRRTTLKEQFDLLRKENEAKIMEKVLEEARFSKSEAAKILGISRTTLWKKLKEAGLN